MKKLLYFLMIIAGVSGAFSCTRNFDEINTNPNNIDKVAPRQLLPPALVDMMNFTMQRNRNFNNELMQVTVAVSDGEGQVHRYDFRSNWADYLYNGLYGVLTDIKDVYRIASSDSLGFKNDSYAGISLILQSRIYSILTDTYGDIPFSQSNSGREEYGSIMEPAFEAQKDIYLGLFDMLEEANTLLAANTAIEEVADPIYKGNIARWRRFGNSLYLRLLLRVAGKAEVAAEARAKMKEIVENPSKYPIMTNNDESAILRWTGTGAYISPYATVREQDFRAPGIASFFIDNLLDWVDPRIDLTYGRSSINRFAIAPAGGQFAGMPSGYAPGSNPVKRSYFYSNTSAYSIQTEPLAGTLMNYGELQLILAEAALKGWINGNPGDYYNKGVEASIKLWVPTWNVPVVEYLTAADMQWLDGETVDVKMQKIHLHKYYALFLVDMQQWFEYRRTGKPVLPIGAGVRNNGVMPARMTYPVYVQSTNPTNYKNAIAMQGADVISTQVWWQKP
jgi:hypothetical protein